MALKFIVEHDTFNVISAYTTQIGLGEHLKINFWEDLEGSLQDILQGEMFFLEWGIYGYICSVSEGFESVL